MGLRRAEAQLLQAQKAVEEARAAEVQCRSQFALERTVTAPRVGRIQYRIARGPHDRNGSDLAAAVADLERSM